MKSRFTPEENRMIDYLLGRLPEEERQEIAERALADEETWMSLLAMEETLLDGYVRGEIGPRDARLMESTLLATVDGQTRLRTARALLERQRRAQPARQRLWWMTAAAALLLTAIGIGLLNRSAPPARSPAPLATLVLRPQVFRDRGEVPRISLPSGSGPVQFVIAIQEADRAERYEIHLNTPNRGKLILEAREVRDGPSLSIRTEISRESLSRGRHEFELYGIAAGSSRLLAYAAVDLLTDAER